MEWPADALRQPTTGTRDEWVLPDGLGGWAAGAASGLRTRRAHGLLTVAARPPLDRYLLLAELDCEVVAPGGEPVALSGHDLYVDEVRPDGLDRLERFSLTPVPTWRWVLDGAAVERRVVKPRDQAVTLVVWSLSKGAAPLRLVLRPLLAFRRPEERTWANEDADPAPRQTDGGVAFSLYEGLPSLVLSGPFEFSPEPRWWPGFRYRDDEAVGRGDGEDLLCPGTLVGELRPDAPLAVVASAEPVAAGDWPALLERGLTEARESAFPLPVEGADDRVTLLADTAAAHVVRQGDRGTALLTGYPGPTRSARDVSIALPGLCLVQERYDEARQLLETLVGQTSKGLLPSRWAEDGTPEYGGVDTSLWFFLAVYKYLQYTEDFAFARSSLFWTLVEIVGHLQRGTMPGVRSDRSDELLVTGEDEGAWTWMDARHMDGTPATPRVGKCVEVNALWYNAACVVEWVANKLGRIDLMRKHRGLANRLREAFNRVFPNPRAGGLHDCVAEDRPDEAVRPNQIVAVALPFPLLTGDRQEAVVSLVERTLLTPYGLRTLAPQDPAYVGTEPEDGFEAAAAAHQGSAHPWLLGQFLTAAAKVRGSQQGFVAAAEGWLAPLLDHLAGPGAGHLPERFDGDAPHTPRGCPTSARGEAEVLRAYVEVVHEYPAFNVRSAG